MKRKFFIRALLAGFLSLVVASCDGTRSKPVPNPPVVTDSDKCAAACKHLVDIKCEIGQVLPDGTTCQEMCEYIQSQGVWLNPTCVMTAKKCDDVESVCSEGKEARAAVSNNRCLW